MSLAGWLASAAAAAAQTHAVANALARDVFTELVQIKRPTDSIGDVTSAAQAMAARLRAGGFAAADVQLLGPNERKRNLVVRLHGTGGSQACALIGYLDVVEAHRKDWSTDPCTFVEKDGYFYGRGTQDMKGGYAIMVTKLLRLKKEGLRPHRDIILALTADEVAGAANGV